MLEKVQEKLYQRIKNDLLDKMNTEVPFKYFLINWFPKQNIPDKDFTRALLDFDKKYNLDHIIILNGKGAMAVRFWWKKNRISENDDA